MFIVSLAYIVRLCYNAIAIKCNAVIKEVLL